MTHGKSEAWCAGFAIVYATKRTSCQRTLLTALRGFRADMKKALGRPRTSPLFLRANPRILQ